MKHAAQLVDILNETGDITGQKPRRDIDKARDIYHGVYVLFITPREEMVFGTIPERDDLPNLYANQYGSTLVTIRRSQEMSREAAVRGIARELFIRKAEPDLVGESMEKLSDGRWHFMSVFTMRAEMPETYSQLDIKELTAMSKTAFETLLADQPERIAPTMRLIWHKYGGELPV